MYVGFVVVLLGWGIFLSNIVSMLLVFLFFLHINSIQIKHEELALVKLFGSEYLEYKKCVRRWL